MKAVCHARQEDQIGPDHRQAPNKEDKNERIVADIDLVDFSVDPLSHRHEG